MLSEVVIVGARDGAVEQMLNACGMRTRGLSASDFPSLAHATSPQPDFVVVDLRGNRPLPGPVAALRLAHPGTGVLLVASALEPALMLEAMRAGVTECVAEPLAQPEFEAAIARLMAHRQGSRTGLVLAFVGAKGGVGTTTTAVNVAAALTTHGAPQALLIDLHLSHGDAAVFLGAEPRFSIVDALENMPRLDHAFFKSLVCRTKSGPDLLASSDRALVAPSVAQGVRRLVELAAGLYRYTILDVPHSDPAVWEALDAAAKIVMVANQELATVRNAARVGEALWQRYGKDRVTVLVNRYDPEAEIGQDDVQRVTGLRVRTTVPSDYRVALQALNRGRPLTLDNHNKLSGSYRQLAQDLAGTTKPEKLPPGGGFLDRLLGRS